MRTEFMKKSIKGFISCMGLLCCLFFTPVITSAADVSGIELPEPQIQEGMSVMQALAKRQTSRSFVDKDISSSQLSHILWAANGINRQETGGRTNPVALGVHSVEVYVVTAKGIFLYHPKTHTLQLIAEGDFRMATTTGQSFVGNAPLNLIYVGNSAAWQNAQHVPPIEKQMQFDCIAAGAMAQSVGLTAASEGLGTCVRGSVDHEAFVKAAHLQEGQSILIAQTIGVLP